MAGFKGSGGPPPSVARERGVGGGSGRKPYSFRLYEKLPSGKNKGVGLLSIDQGDEDVEIIILDEALPGGDEEWQPSIHIHDGFLYNGTYANTVICRRNEPEGCLLDIALQEPHTHAPWCKEPKDPDNPQEGECTREGQTEPRMGGWRWVATAIKCKPFTFERGPLKGKTIPYHRCLLLATEESYKMLLTYRKAYASDGGLRGRRFKVSRSQAQRSARIGDKWDPDGRMSDEEMMERFRDTAGDYGLPVENYIKPMNYAQVLALPTAERMAQIAKWVAGERGVRLELPDGTTVGDFNPVASSVGGSGGGAEDESPDTDVPF